MMEDYKYIKGGEIVAIPLFIKDNKAKLKKEDFNKEFAFARAITERGGAQIIEIFNKTGNIDTDINEILNSGLLRKPLYTVWSGIIKKRWKVIHQTENYNKERDSNYNDIELVLGGMDDLRIWHAKDNSETPITKEDFFKGNYQLMAIYDYIQIERKILESLGR